MPTIEAKLMPLDGTGDGGVLVFTVLGQPNATQLIEAIHRHIGATPRRFVLWDFLAADGALLAREDMMRVLEASQQYTKVRERGRSAIVTRARPTAERSSAVFDALRLAWPDSIEYGRFHDIATALAWLRKGLQ